MTQLNRGSLIEFTYINEPGKHFIDINCPYIERIGWMWGSDGTEFPCPLIRMEFMGLKLLYLDTGPGFHFHLSILGFWCIL